MTPEDLRRRVQQWQLGYRKSGYTPELAAKFPSLETQASALLGDLLAALEQQERTAHMVAYEDFETWWQQHGLGLMGDPRLFVRDMARATWKACEAHTLAAINAGQSDVGLQEERRQFNARIQELEDAMDLEYARGCAHGDAQAIAELEQQAQEIDAYGVTLGRIAGESATDHAESIKAMISSREDDCTSWRLAYERAEQRQIDAETNLLAAINAGHRDDDISLRLAALKPLKVEP